MLVGSIFPARCSTPFGITGRITRSRTNARTNALVLNAFRHHRKDHIRQLARMTGTRYVLNAFRHHRKDHGFFADTRDAAQACSTPFGITGRITQISTCRQPPISKVLNAFRHHRKDHVCISGSTFAVDTVLNAFRHHRKDHDGRILAQPWDCLCSTPFGITGRITQDPRRVSRELAGCSTPFGITGRITR